MLAIKSSPLPPDSRVKENLERGWRAWLCVQSTHATTQKFSAHDCSLQETLKAQSMPSQKVVIFH